MSSRVALSYTPHRYAVKLHLAHQTHRVRAAVTGARGGKTTAGCWDVLDKLILQPGFSMEDADRGEPYTVVVSAPRYADVDRLIHPTLQSIIPEDLKIGPYHGTKRRQVLQGRYGQTHLYYLSAGRPETWQGLKLYGAWIDEFTLCKEGLYDEARTRLSDRNGWLLLTGTPRGPTWAKSRIHDAWKNKTDKDIYFITWRTIDNPYFEGNIEHLRATTPEKWFKRNYEASWDTFQGQIYEDWHEKIHVYDPRRYSFVLPTGRTDGRGPTEIVIDKVNAGVDWGYGPGHPGAIVVGGYDTQGEWWILDESVDEQLLVAAEPNSDSWIRRARSLVNRWGVSMFYADSAQPQNLKAFQRAGLVTRAARKGPDSVLPGIQAVSRYMAVKEDDSSGKVVFETRFHVSQKCETVRDEFTYYHWSETNRDAPEKAFDHTMDAIRYLIYTDERDGTFNREKDYAA